MPPARIKSQDLPLESHKFKDTSVSLPVGYQVLYSELPPVLLAMTSPSKQEEERAEVQVVFTEKLQVVHLERL